MSEDIRTLPIVKKVPLPEDTRIYLVDGPTLFYHSRGEPHKLYTHDKQGKEVTAKLPDCRPLNGIYGVGAYGNALYFDAGIKVYKAMYTTQGSIEVSFVRKLKDEAFDHHNRGVVATCTKKTDDGKTYVYRLCDDPDRDAILVSDDELKGKKATGVHRGRAIYIMYNKKITPVVRKYNNELILVEGCFHTVYTQDSSPFCYFTKFKLYVLDTRTMQFLPAMEVNVVGMFYITNISNTGTIAMEWCHPDGYSFVLAKLPDGYFDPTVAVSRNSQSQHNQIMRVEEKSASEERERMERLRIREKEESGAFKKMEVQQAKVPSSSATSGYSSAIEGQSSRKSIKELMASLNAPLNKPVVQSGSSATVEFESEFLKKFKPVGILGIGGFGCVFEAENVVDKWKYAVKRIPLRGSEESVNEALAEVCTLASLRHEGIVGYNCSWIEKPPPKWQNRSDVSMLKSMGSSTTFNYRDDCTFLYVQMELCSHTLQEVLHYDTDRDIRNAKRFFEQIVSAVKYLHENNKIHRDLKPSNILFSNDPSHRLKICDLGLVADRAVKNGQEVDRTRTVAGTLMYMAPEQNGKYYSSKVDIYSLGLILTELCVKMDFSKMDEVFLNYQRGRPNRILNHLPVVAQLVSKMTNLDPTKRPTCEEILQHEFIKCSSEGTSEDASRASVCVICLERQPNIVFFDCMHVAVCEECMEDSKKNPSHAIRTCPNCREVVKKSKKVFL